jgi:hypothetical protein
MGAEELEVKQDAELAAADGGEGGSGSVGSGSAHRPLVGGGVGYTTDPRRCGLRRGIVGDSGLGSRLYAANGSSNGSSGDGQAADASENGRAACVDARRD